MAGSHWVERLMIAAEVDWIGVGVRAGKVSALVQELTVRPGTQCRDVRYEGLQCLLIEEVVAIHLDNTASMCIARRVGT